MSQIQNYANRKEVVEGRPSQVLAVTSVEWDAFRFTNSIGEVDVGLSLAFGVDPKTGEEQIAIIEPSTLRGLLAIPSPHIREGIKKARRARKSTGQVPVDLPEGIGGLAQAEIGEQP